MKVDISDDDLTQRLGPQHSHGATLTKAVQGDPRQDRSGMSLARCRLYIFEKTPALPTPLSVFSSNKGWYQHQVLRDLFREYVESGLIEMAPSDTTKGPALEHAIAAGSIDTVKALLEMGADERVIPSPANWIHLDVSDDGEDFVPAPEMKDVYEFIHSVHGDKEVGAQMTALLREHAMNRRIREQSVASQEASAPDEGQGIRKGRRAAI